MVEISPSPAPVRQSVQAHDEPSPQTQTHPQNTLCPNKRLYLIMCVIKNLKGGERNLMGGEKVWGGGRRQGVGDWREVVLACRWLVKMVKWRGI